MTKEVGELHSSPLNMPQTHMQALRVLGINLKNLQGVRS